MPIQASAFRLPSGAQAVRVEATGVLGKEEADAWFRQIDPGGPFHALPILVIALRIDRISSEARRMFARPVGDTNRAEVWIAAAVTNPVIRVTTNFVMRISRTRKMRLFATEEEAVRWLDERVREDAAGKAGH